MSKQYNVIINSDEVNQSPDFELQMRLNDIDPTDNVKLTFSNIESATKKLRTSTSILNKLHSDILKQNYFSTPNASFTTLHQAVVQQFLKRLRTTQCFAESTIEGEFQNPKNKYAHETLNLHVRLQEQDINSFELGLSAIKNPRCGSLFAQWSLKNLLGQCEGIDFLYQRSFLDASNQQRILAGLTLPFASPHSFIQRYSFTAKRLNLLNDLQSKQYQFNLQLKSVTDPRWQYSIRTTSHHLAHPTDLQNYNQDLNQNNMLNATKTTYQNAVLSADFTTEKLPTPEDPNTESSHLKASIGAGSNHTLFAKVAYKSNYRTVNPINFTNFAFNSVFENKLSIAAVLTQNSSKLSFVERLTLHNQPGYTNIALNNVNLNSDVSAYGQLFQATNQIRLYFPKFPFISRIGIQPFIGAYAAFVPTNLKVTENNKIPQYINQNVRVSAGIGLTLNINEQDRVDFLYNFGDFLPKPSNMDAFAQFQIQFYQA